MSTITTASPVSATSAPTVQGLHAVRAELQRVAFYVPGIAIVMAWALHATSRRQQHEREEGASIVEWVIITAVVAVAVIAIGTILVQKFTDKANSVNLG